MLAARPRLVWISLDASASVHAGGGSGWRQAAVAVRGGRGGATTRSHSRGRGGRDCAAGSSEAINAQLLAPLLCALLCQEDPNKEPPGGHATLRTELQGALHPDMSSINRLASLALLFGSVSGLSFTESGVFSTLQLAVLKDGVVDVPQNLEHALVEIGCSDFDTLALDTLPDDPLAFSLSFEPMLDKYATLMAQSTDAVKGANGAMAIDQTTSVGRLGSNRGIVLPLAVSPHGGNFEFHVASQAGCSSILEHNSNSTWGKNCDGQFETRRVESVTLAQALALVPERLPIKQLKIDAQGVDVCLIKATPPELLRQRVMRIDLEVRSSKCTPLYEGQADCNEVVSSMASLGFTNTTSCPSPGTGARDVTVTVALTLAATLALAQPQPWPSPSPSP